MTDTYQEAERVCVETFRNEMRKRKWSDPEAGKAMADEKACLEIAARETIKAYRDSAHYMQGDWHPSDRDWETICVFSFHF